MASLFGCVIWEWCVLIACIGGVLTAELFNSSIETLFRELPEEIRDRAWPALDIAAGAVLLASVSASVLGLIVLMPRLAERFGVHNDEVKGSPGGRDLVKFSKVKPMKFLFLFV